MPKMLLICEHCGKETDLLPQLLSCLGWQERDDDILEPVWGDFIHHNFTCSTPDCRGGWGMDLFQSEWVPLHEAVEAEKTAKEAGPHALDHIPGVIEHRWVEANRYRLMSECEGQWIAVKGERLVASAYDPSALKVAVEIADVANPYITRMVRDDDAMMIL